MSGGARTTDRRSRLGWLLVGGAAAGVTVVGSSVVARTAGAPAGERWLLVAGVVSVYEMAFLAYHRTRGEGGPRSVGVANAVTLARGALYAAVAGFLLVPPTGTLAWAPGLCYAAGAGLDAVDGFLARRTGGASELGARLDHAFDTLGFLVAPLVAVAWGRLPVWYLSLSAARYLFRLGRWRRRRAGRPVHPLPESRIRRRLAALQMAFISVALVPVAPAAVLHPAAAVVLTPSLAGFIRDWLVVSGRLPRHEE